MKKKILPAYSKYVNKNLTQAFTNAGNETIAVQQATYMKNLFPFMGIKKPERAALEKEIIKQHPISSEQELIEIVQSLWEQPEREYQYTAMILLQKNKKLWTPNMLPLFKTLITTKSWWDTVDTVASNCVGPLLQKYPELRATMNKWISHENMWLRRTALLYQLKYKEQTDKEKLFEHCEKTMHEKEFFIRKAIGWVLREYSKTNPEAVKEFIEDNKEKLSGLSIREGSKYIV